MGEVVVVGAGPYGLSIAAHLRKAGVGVRIFGDQMASWRHHMPAGMYLKSTPDASSLSAPTPGSSIFDYCAAIGSEALVKEDAIPIDLFIDYGMWFADRHVPDVEPESVVGRPPRRACEFEVQLSSGEELRADSVVVACGVIPYAYTPPELLALSPSGPSANGLLSHTAQHSELSVFSGRRVAVVGAGQSALENAALLAESGADVHVLVRGDEVLWGAAPDGDPTTRLYRMVKPPSALGEGWAARSMSGAPGVVRHLPARARLALVKAVLGPSGAWWLRDRVEGKVDIRTGVTVHSATALPGRRWRPALTRIAQRWRRRPRGRPRDGRDRLPGRARRASRSSAPSCGRRLRTVAGSPLLNASFESSVPGLYFSGLTAAATFGPLLRFVHGSGFAARRIGAAVPARRQPATV